MSADSFNLDTVAAIGERVLSANHGNGREKATSGSFALDRVILDVAPFRGRFEGIRSACPIMSLAKRCAYPTTASETLVRPVQKSCRKAHRLGY
jgi:hypothetical protein